MSNIKNSIKSNFIDMEGDDLSRQQRFPKPKVRGSSPLGTANIINHFR
jgi:hypothetical protein